MRILEQHELNNEFICQQLKLLRLSNDKKINEIAEATGYTPSYISLIENGKRNLNYKVLRRILLYGFGETLSSFFVKILEDDGLFNDSKIYKTPLKLYDEDKTTSVEILIPTNASREIELVKVHLSEGAVFEDNFKIDFKVYGTVLNGVVEAHTPKQKAKIHQRESFLFFIQVEDALEQTYFKISNISKSESELLLIFTPPVF